MKVEIMGMKGILEAPEGNPKGAVLLLHGRDYDHTNIMFKTLESEFKDYWRLRADFSFVKNKKVSDDLVDEVKQAQEMLSFLLRRAGTSARDCLVVGKSLGAAVASKLATLYSFKGVALLGYPLHEANDPTAWFSQEHLSKIKSGSLIICGDKDKYCNPSMARSLKAKNNKLDLVIVDNATHSFNPTNKRNSLEENQSYVSKVVKAWIEQ